MGQISDMAAKKDLEQVKRLARKGAEFAKDFAPKLGELFQNSALKPPRDLATISFFEFIKSSRGEALMNMLSIQGMVKAICKMDNN